MGVLLLNASWEPLHVLPLKRAVVLLLEEKAEIVEGNDDEPFRSENLIFARPNVIRLKYFVKIPYRKKVALSKTNVLIRDNYECGYCGAKLTNKSGTVDHVHPKAKGGTNTWDNVVAACQPCNQKKSDRLLSELGWKLRVKPDQPMVKRWVIVGTVDDAWEPYLEDWR